jgi:hypothetical protein
MVWSVAIDLRRPISASTLGGLVFPPVSCSGITSSHRMLFLKYKGVVADTNYVEMAQLMVLILYAASGNLAASIILHIWHMFLYLTLSLEENIPMKLSQIPLSSILLKVCHDPKIPQQFIYDACSHFHLMLRITITPKS